MQVAGRSCDVCGEKIRTALDAVGCEHCDVAHHVDCLEDEEVCACCGLRFGEAEKHRRAVDDAAGRRRYEQGRAIVATLFSVLVLSSGFVNFWIASNAESDEKTIQVIVRFTLLCGLLWMTWIGKAWARVVTSTLLAFSGALAVLLGLMAYREMAVMLGIFGAGAFCLLTAGALFAMPSVRWFLDAQRYGRHSGVGEDVS